MIEIRTNPSRRELQWFGLLFAAFLAVIGAIAYWQFGSPRTGQVLWGIGAAGAAVYYAIPPVRKPLFVGWMCAAYPIGWVVSHTLMAVIFYLVFTPIGLLMRLVGYDPMQRKSEPEADSYWVEHNPGGEPQRYFRQF